MKNRENEQKGECRPVTGWDKIHALALCVLAVVGIVIFVGPYVERLFVHGGGRGLGTQMLRIRKFGENPCGYDAALWNFRFFCAATPQRVRHLHLLPPP